MSVTNKPQSPEPGHLAEISDAENEAIPASPKYSFEAIAFDEHRYPKWKVAGPKDLLDLAHSAALILVDGGFQPADIEQLAWEVKSFVEMVCDFEAACFRDPKLNKRHPVELVREASTPEGYLRVTGESNLVFHLFSEDPNDQNIPMLAKYIEGLSPTKAQVLAAYALRCSDEAASLIDAGDHFKAAARIAVAGNVLSMASAHFNVEGRDSGDYAALQRKEMARTGGKMKAERVYGAAKDFVISEWQKSSAGYAGNKSDFARTYVKLILTQYKISVTEDTIKRSWLKGK